MISQRSKHIRARIRHAALTRAPLWLTGGKRARARFERPLHIVRPDIALPKLPPALDGLRITHLSDFHIGHLTTPAYLPHIIETCEKLAGDLIALTGDFVDLNLDVLDPVVDALLQLKAPLGVHLVLGNHDHLVNGPEVVRRFREAGLGLLVNQSLQLHHKNCPITLAGIDFAANPRKLAQLVHRTISRARNPRNPDRDGLTLLLAHHPDAFDAACRHDVDLTLSGHTHGGQVVFTNKRGIKGSIGLGSMAFQYPRGLYQRGGSYLYVNSGVGAWFPLRVNCPAEIAQLKLVRA